LDVPPCHIDDAGPFPVVRPASVAEVGELVRQAAAREHALYPLGGRTMLDYGLPPTRPGVAVDLRGLAQVIDYPARDMTVTVQAGMTVAGLRDLLRAENQRLPIDVPQADRATLGGAIATNTSGPRRLGFGTLRDYVIGISVVNDEGHEVKAGGRVVKNVAGYDFCKLYTGSLGTLGIITQVTLKLRPLPEEHALVTLGCETDALEGTLDRLHSSRTRPVCLDVLNRAAAAEISRGGQAMLPESPWVVVVGFEDNREAVVWQVQQLVHELTAAQTLGLDARVSDAAAPLWQALVEFPARPGSFSFKANLRPGATAGFCREVSALPERPLLQAHAGSGILVGRVDAALTPERAGEMLKRMHELAAAGCGTVAVLRCPAEWKRRLPVWGPSRDDVPLMRAVKERLDPRRIFNPGRFVDGI
jgi:glycolate oxidase FAD binding subunit